MKVIEKSDVVYTQQADVPIEERVFFRQAIGVAVDDGRFRPATVADLEERERYLVLLKTYYEG